MRNYGYNGMKNICGERIYEARHKSSMTQSELAEKLRNSGVMVERESISRAESGIRFIADYEVRELAKVLDVTVGWLLGIE